MSHQTDSAPQPGNVSLFKKHICMFFFSSYHQIWKFVQLSLNRSSFVFRKTKQWHHSVLPDIQFANDGSNRNRRLFEEASSLSLSSPQQPQHQQHTDRKHRCAGVSAVTATGNSNKWVFLFVIKLYMSTPRKTQWLQLEKNEAERLKRRTAGYR